MYRICKTIEIENGHFLSKNKSRCKVPHGHTRKIQIVLTAENLDDNDMVCDFKAIKLAIHDHIDSFDHAMVVNKNSPHYDYFIKNFDRVITVDGRDPTTEVIAELIFKDITNEFKKEKTYKSSKGHSYRISSNVVVERVRVSEGSNAWAEYSLP